LPGALGKQSAVGDGDDARSCRLLLCQQHAQIRADAGRLACGQCDYRSAES
jgi:hypothetical protein